MDSLNALQLDLWRLACGPAPLSDAITAIADRLRHRLPLDRLLLLAVDSECTQLLPIAQVNVTNTTSASAPLFDQAQAWCLQSQLARGPVTQIAAELPGLIPRDWTGDVLAVGLHRATTPLGIWLLGTALPNRFLAEQEPIVAALSEPIATAVHHAQRWRELTSLREAAEADRRSLLARLGRPDITDTIIGAGSGLREVLHGVEQVARSTAPVLILGETGSGKEVIARAIHTHSMRRNGPFLRVNCGAIPPELADSELFGHERGSFTGAAQQRKGWFERADGGTLFLDEIGELTPAVQVRLLRVLQDGSFERVGGQQVQRVDVRLVAATHRDLHAMVQDGHFRADLWYRINVFPLRLPALRERPEDIPPLATHFAHRAAERLGLTPQLPTPTDLERLMAYDWPGNVRELAAVIERAAILGEGRHLKIERALGVSAPGARPIAPRPLPDAAPDTGANLTLDAVMTAHIERTLAQTLGRIDGPFGAAQRLAIHPDTLRSRMRKLGINWQRYRSTSSH